MLKKEKNEICGRDTSIKQVFFFKCNYQKKNNLNKSNQNPKRENPNSPLIQVYM